MSLTFAPLTPARWPDLEQLFGPRGASSGCWCMYWRCHSRREYEQGQGEQNKNAFRHLVEQGKATGILAYRDGKPIGWCAFGPRESFPALDRARTLVRIDATPVISLPCLYIAKAERHRGVSKALLKAAIDYFRTQGGAVLEGYPVATEREVPEGYAWTGFLAAFEQAGFRECGPRKGYRATVRKTVRPARGGRYTRR